MANESLTFSFVALLRLICDEWPEHAPAAQVPDRIGHAQRDVHREARRQGRAGQVRDAGRRAVRLAARCGTTSATGAESQPELRVPRSLRRRGRAMTYHLAEYI